MTNWHRFDNREAMVDALKSAISGRLSSAVASRGRASWAVSGGSTPAPLLQAMQNEPLPWDRIDVALVDERWVPLDHPRSNEAFVAANLKGGKAAAISITGMKTEHGDAAEGVDAVNLRYGKLVQPFDSILLGLGPDGHTASLFPGADGLAAAFDPDADTCVALTAKRSDVTGDEVERMSLSAAAIGRAPHVVMMITGSAKQRVLEEAMQPESDLPVGKLQKMKHFDVYWAP